MDGADDVRSGDVQDLVAALELLEVLQRQIVALQHRSHGAIRNHHASRQRCTEVGCRRRGCTEFGCRRRGCTEIGCRRRGGTEIGRAWRAGIGK